MAIADKFKSVIDTVINTCFRDEEEDELYKNFMGEGEATYPVEDNAALKPAYTTEPKQKVVPINNYKGYEVMVCEPRSYEDSISIVKHLKERKTIVLNLHLLDKEQALRIVDFLCGATHALEGSQQKIGDSVFIFTPKNVALSAESQKSKLFRDALWNQPEA